MDGAHAFSHELGLVLVLELLQLAVSDVQLYSAAGCLQLQQVLSQLRVLVIGLEAHLP
jgi:hypothetical protein